MEILYTYLSIFATFFFLYKIIQSLKPNNKKHPPSPPSYPILGHLHLLKPPFHRTLQSLAQRYGPIFSLKLGLQRALVVSSAWAAEECFSQNDVVFANRPKFIVGQHLGYNHSILIWSPYGDYWRNLRRVTTITMLSMRRINEAGPTRKVEIRNMIMDLLESSNFGSGTQKVNMNEVLSKLARNFVMRIVNGKSWEKMIIKPPENLMNICDFLPFLRWVDFKGIEKDLKEKQVERDEFLQSLVDEIRESRKKGEDLGMNTLIEQLLDLQQAEPDQYSDETIKGIILVIINLLYLSF